MGRVNHTEMEVLCFYQMDICLIVVEGKRGKLKLWIWVSEYEGVNITFICSFPYKVSTLVYNGPACDHRKSDKNVIDKNHLKKMIIFNQEYEGIMIY